MIARGRRVTGHRGRTKGEKGSDQSKEKWITRRRERRREEFKGNGNKEEALQSLPNPVRPELHPSV